MYIPVVSDMYIPVVCISCLLLKYTYVYNVCVYDAVVYSVSNLALRPRGHGVDMLDTIASSGST